jgi:hypothetical protein
LPILVTTPPAFTKIPSTYEKQHILRIIINNETIVVTPDSRWGLFPRTLHELLQHSTNPNNPFQLQQVSSFEIYTEQIIDILPSSHLASAAAKQMQVSVMLLALSILIVRLVCTGTATATSYSINNP